MIGTLIMLLTLTPLTWKIWWVPNNASRWQMGFNWAFKGLKKELQTLKSLNCEISQYSVEYNWNVMAHGDAREWKWKGNCWMQWVASTIHTTSEHGVSSITTADAHTSAASSRMNWRPHQQI